MSMLPEDCVKLIRVYDATPLAPQLFVNGELPNQALQISVNTPEDTNVLAGVYRGRIEHYQPLPSSAETYRRNCLSVAAADSSVSLSQQSQSLPLFGLEEIFGPGPFNMLYRAAMLCRYMGADTGANILLNFVAIMCLQFYVCVRERFMQYHPIPFAMPTSLNQNSNNVNLHPPFNESYPPCIFVLMNAEMTFDETLVNSILYGYSSSKKKKNKNKKRSKSTASSSSSNSNDGGVFASDKDWIPKKSFETLANTLPLSMFFYVIAWAVARDPVAQQAAGKAMFTDAQVWTFAKMSMHKNHRVSFDSRHFAQLWISDFVTKYNDCASRIYANVSGRENAQVLSIKLQRFFQQTPIFSLELHGDTKDLARTPMFYTHLQFDPYKPAIVVPAQVNGDYERIDVNLLALFDFLESMQFFLCATDINDLRKTVTALVKTCVPANERSSLSIKRKRSSLIETAIVAPDSDDIPILVATADGSQVEVSQNPPSAKRRRRVPDAAAVSSTKKARLRKRSHAEFMTMTYNDMDDEEEQDSKEEEEEEDKEEQEEEDEEEQENIPVVCAPGEGHLPKAITQREVDPKLRADLMIRKGQFDRGVLYSEFWKRIDPVRLRYAFVLSSAVRRTRLYYFPPASELTRGTKVHDEMHTFNEDSPLHYTPYRVAHLTATGTQFELPIGNKFTTATMKARYRFLFEASFDTDAERQVALQQAAAANASSAAVFSINLRMDANGRACVPVRYWIARLFDADSEQLSVFARKCLVTTIEETLYDMQRASVGDPVDAVAAQKRNVFNAFIGFSCIGRKEEDVLWWTASHFHQHVRLADAKQAAHYQKQFSDMLIQEVKQCLQNACSGFRVVQRYGLTGNHASILDTQVLHRSNPVGSVDRRFFWKDVPIDTREWYTYVMCDPRLFRQTWTFHDLRFVLPAELTEQHGVTEAMLLGHLHRCVATMKVLPLNTSSGQDLMHVPVATTAAANGGVVPTMSMQDLARLLAPQMRLHWLMFLQYIEMHHPRQLIGYRKSSSSLSASDVFLWAERARMCHMNEIEDAEMELAIAATKLLATKKKRSSPLRDAIFKLAAAAITEEAPTVTAKHHAFLEYLAVSMRATNAETTELKSKLNAALPHLLLGEESRHNKVSMQTTTATRVLSYALCGTPWTQDQDVSLLVPSFEHAIHVLLNDPVRARDDNDKFSYQVTIELNRIVNGIARNHPGAQKVLMRFTTLTPFGRRLFAIISDLRQKHLVQETFFVYSDRLLVLTSPPLVPPSISTTTTSPSPTSSSSSSSSSSANRLTPSPTAATSSVPGKAAVSGFIPRK